MKTRITIAATLAILGGILTSITAQVGIGTATPHSSSILDLRNTSGKGLVLPTASSKPDDLTDTIEALTYYYSNGLYLKDAQAFNNLNAWKYKYNGAITEDVTFNPASMVGVGIGISSGNVLSHLHVSDVGKEVVASGISSAFFIGTTGSDTLMLFDADEIMVKTTSTTGGTLKLQEEDGSLQIGSDRVENTDNIKMFLNTVIGSTTNNKSLTVHGNVNAQDGKVQEKGYDLVPPGTIVAFYGAVPKGWAPCDGKKYSLNASGVAVEDATNGAQTPDLKGRKIVGEGAYSNTSVTPNDTKTYTYNTTGGFTTHTLATTNLPNHQHSGSTENDGTHVHNANFSNVADNDDFDHYHGYIGDGDVGTHGHGAGTIRSGGSNHRHKFDLDGDGTAAHPAQKCEGCNATAYGIESPYYVLRYIMKL